MSVLLLVKREKQQPEREDKTREEKEIGKVEGKRKKERWKES